MEYLPEHLKKYIVQQNYSRYTPIDQAVWRYILRQLKKFLSVNAHESYLEGLKKTGIEIEQIPHIENISAKLQKFGWRALPVSGFIPPAAFMELQSLGVLPIACDMRSIDHLMYTPAPDIVHEAAGHAPIIVNEEYAAYLKQYAQVAKKAILSKQDLDQYEAIRVLSDIKENPNSKSEDISKAEEKLKQVSQNIKYTSEAAELSRMNWWTAEYGLVESEGSVKIFGAGLLSSLGESKWCLSDKVKKIPLTVDCVKQGYDITEPQPQLFVVKNFKDLSKVLQQFSKTMAYQAGGVTALEKILQSKAINTIEFENGFQISGLLKNYKTTSDQSIAYVQFQGPTQLCYKDHEISGHGCDYHVLGYGTPIGAIMNFDLGQLQVGQQQILNYTSGVKVTGVVKKILRVSAQATILTLTEATSQLGSEILFKPEWGDYDIILAHNVVSGFGGAADRKAFGEIEDFVATQIPEPIYTEKQKKIFSFFQAVRDLRQNEEASESDFNELFLKISQQAPNEWLLFVELVEISYLKKFNTDFVKLILFHLDKLSQRNVHQKNLIDDGLALAKDNFHENN
jgi:phenylalanine-4-hydroxylase